MWKYTGKERPEFAEKPDACQESVWDYPRPPILVNSNDLVEVKTGKDLIASTTSSLRVLETASPPTYYLPASAINWDLLVSVAGGSFCEWKGRASYWALASAPQVAVAWMYENPSESFAAIHKHISFYPAKVECFVSGERVKPQPGDFYGGWITRKVAGPFKGDPGTGHW